MPLLLINVQTVLLIIKEQEALWKYVMISLEEVVFKMAVITMIKLLLVRSKKVGLVASTQMLLVNLLFVLLYQWMVKWSATRNVTMGIQLIMMNAQTRAKSSAQNLGL